MKANKITDNTHRNGIVQAKQYIAEQRSFAIQYDCTFTNRRTYVEGLSLRGIQYVAIAEFLPNECNHTFRKTNGDLITILSGAGSYEEVKANVVARLTAEMFPIEQSISKRQKEINEEIELSKLI